MKPKDLLDRNYPPNILIYGPAGSYKTALVSQASNAYMFDFDDGMRTAATFKDKFFEQRQGIEFDIYKDKLVTKPTAYMLAKKKLLAISEACAKNQWKHDCCIIDSLTGLCRACQSYIMSLPSAGNQEGDPLKMPERNHWGPMVNEVENILTILRSLNVLTIVTAHGMSLTVDEMEKFFPKSITKPHSEAKLVWLFDEVWYTKIRRGAQKKIEGLVSGRSTNSIQARTRSGLLDDVVHTDIGLVGLLDKIGFKYGNVEKVI